MMSFPLLGLMFQKEFMPAYMKWSGQLSLGMIKFIKLLSLFVAFSYVLGHYTVINTPIHA